MQNENKLEIIRLLKEALLSEEKAIPIYNRHLESSVFWTGIDDDGASKARDVLRVLSRDSLRHKMTVEKILGELSLIK